MAEDLPHLTCAELRELDRLATEELGLPSVVLMENAGRGAAEVLLSELGPPSPEAGPEVVVLCGGGNNAGDGYVLARHLANAGRRVLLGETRPAAELSRDAAIFRHAAVAMGLEHVDLAPPGAWATRAARLTRVRVLVDALLGTGSRGEPRSPVAELVGAADRLAAGTRGALLRVALDVPSGLDADTGFPARATFRADLTLTFAAPKIGFRQPAAAPYLGTVRVLSIGTPAELAHRAGRARLLAPPRS